MTKFVVYLYFNINNMIGIYKITNLVNNKSYIGSSINLNKRKNTHFRNLKNNKHPNLHLQASCNKYGINNFSFSIIEESTKENLIEREQYYLDTLKPEYNKRIIAESNLGLGFKVRTGSRLGEKNNFYGKTHSDESKRQMSITKLGKPSRKTVFPGKSISKYSLDNRFIEKYSTLKKAAIENNLPYKWFIVTIKTNSEYKGFIWKKE